MRNKRGEKIISGYHNHNQQNASAGKQNYYTVGSCEVLEGKVWSVYIKKKKDTLPKYVVLFVSKNIITLAINY